jgi:hypothetical protein
MLVDAALAVARRIRAVVPTVCRKFSSKVYALRGRLQRAHAATRWRRSIARRASPEERLAAHDWRIIAIDGRHIRSRADHTHRECAQT